MNKLIPYIVIAALVAIIYLFWNHTENLREENRRLYNNMEQVIVDNNTKLLQLTREEFRLYVVDTLFNKLKDSMDLKWRHIEKTFNIKYHYTYDTTITLIQVKDSSDLFRRFNHKFDPCLSISGWVDLSIDSIHFNAPIQYNSTSIYYWQRPKKFWPIRWLYKKQHYIETENNCAGKDTIMEIQIIKKN